MSLRSFTIGFVRFALVTVIALGALGSVALAQDHEGEMPPMGPPEQMKKITFLQGEWDVTMKMKMDPSQDWQTATATASVKPVLDGCAQQMSYSGDMMGMPFLGMGIDSFNRTTGKYESYWIDNMGAHMSKLTGDFKDGKIVMFGKEVMMGKPTMTKSVTEKRSNDEVFFEMSVSTDEGKTWFTNMTLTYTRKTSS